ncbi:hypothetical protein ABFS82_11G038400 [Erythranthe guttata]|uniref:Uncharacterized protein n=1 Tax=Erythranthe guttata TaxID=4155 RepID=A0A022R2Q4_ERYGU|nr:PREDICTED: uncharacterized protein LOC105960620 [Erythranthe guttata]EYU34922.1 hypothetical protein MIMGU_mgv1a015458mg [Erythranthe guttata]|eukprot:XP_012840266.1 PREDICTED: uncharacterized protein LOC105960620 [Erythranthe guttata]
MARSQENPPPVFTTTAPYSPMITERENEGADEYAGGGCGCFRRFCFGGSRNSLLRERGTGGGSPWLVEKLKKLKELSEMVAGPKWKNFVRRIGKFCSPKKHVNSTQQNAQFQYSPESYALNFSGGDSEDHGGGGEEEEGNLLHSFSSRFASAGRPYQ